MSGIRKDGTKRVKSCKTGNILYCGNTEYKKKNWNTKPPPEYFAELFRVSKKQIVSGGNNFELPVSKGWIVWNKGVSLPTLSQCELIWTSFLGNVKMFNWKWSGFIRKGEYTRTHGPRIHPTQKPIALYKWIFENFAKPGDRILDTHLGSGSSAIAAHDAGLDFVGCELDEDYIKAARERFEKHVAGRQIAAPTSQI